MRSSCSISPASRPSLSAVPAHSRSMDSSASASKREQVPTGPRSYSAGSNQPGSVGQLQEQRGDGFCLRQEMEATILREGGRRLPPARCPMGRNAPALASTTPRALTGGPNRTGPGVWCLDKDNIRLAKEGPDPRSHSEVLHHALYRLWKRSYSNS